MQKLKNIDLEFAFKHVAVECHFVKGFFTKKEIDDIKCIVRNLANEIAIDKSYVNFENTRFEKTFLTEEGWNELCKLLIKTEFDNNSTAEEHENIQIAYQLMIIGYLFLCLNDFGYDDSGIFLEIKENSTYTLKIAIDTTKSYLAYSGKWQTWK